jgi:hypothetical protein
MLSSSFYVFFVFSVNFFLSTFFVVVVAIRESSRGRRCGRLRSSPLAALRFDSHPSPLLAPVPGGCNVDAAGDYVHIHRPYSRPFRAVAMSSPHL